LWFSNCLFRELPRIGFLVSATDFAKRRIDGCRAGRNGLCLLVVEPQLRSGCGGNGAFRRGALYWSPSSITRGDYTYTGNTRGFVTTVPDFHSTPGLIIVAFTAGCILAGVVAFRSRLSLWEVGGSILLVPLAIHIGGCFGGYWFPMEWGMFACGGFVRSRQQLD
jgi:hypothetical protein